MKIRVVHAALSVLAAVAMVGATARCGAAQEKPARPERPDAPEVAFLRGSMFGPGGGSYIGAYIAEVDGALVDRLKLDAERGAHVTGVTDDGPAEKAGLREDDVVVAWNGAPVESAAQLTRLVRETPAGREVELTVVRDGKRQDVKVEVGEREGIAGLREFRMPGLEAFEDLDIDLDVGEGGRGFRFRTPGAARSFVFLGGGRLGAGVQNLGDQLGAYFGLDGRKGVLVSSVEEDSPAAKGGLKAGDVILAFGDEETGDPGELVEAVRDADEGPVSVRILRDRKERTLTVELPAPRGPRWEAAPSRLRSGASAPRLPRQAVSGA